MSINTPNRRPQREYVQQMQCDLNTSIPDWIIEHPETSSVFAELELDTSCGGKSLEYVATRKGLEPRDVLEKLRDALTAQKRKPSADTGL